MVCINSCKHESLEDILDSLLVICVRGSTYLLGGGELLAHERQIDLELAAHGLELRARLVKRGACVLLVLQALLDLSEKIALAKSFKTNMCCVTYLLLFVSAQLVLKRQLLSFTLHLAD